MGTVDLSLALRLGESGFGGFGHFEVALPTFVFQFEGLDGDSVGTGIEFGHGLVFGYPTTIDFVGKGQLPGLVIHFDDEVFAKIFE